MFYEDICKKFVKYFKQDNTLCYLEPLLSYHRILYCSEKQDYQYMY